MIALIREFAIIRGAVIGCGVGLVLVLILAYLTS